MKCHLPKAIVSVEKGNSSWGAEPKKMGEKNSQSGNDVQVFTESDCGIDTQLRSGHNARKDVSGEAGWTRHSKQGLGVGLTHHQDHQKCKSDSTKEEKIKKTESHLLTQKSCSPKNRYSKSANVRCNSKRPNPKKEKTKEKHERAMRMHRKTHAMTGML